MKLFIATLNTETITFSPFPTGSRSFSTDGYLVHHGQHPEDINLSAFPVGVVRGLAETSGWEVIESLCAFASPAGLTVRKVYEEFRREILEDLQVAMPVDVVFFDLHGAMVAEGCPDVEGDLLAHVRQAVGPDVPIGVELDPHCHLTRAKVEHATVIVLQKEYPHIDITDRAADVFHLLADVVAGKTRPHMAVYDCQMILQALHTTREPGRGLVEHIKRLEAEDEDILSVSICHGMQWGDVPEMGVKTLVITDNQPEKGAALAQELGQKLFELRNDFGIDLLTIDETLDRAEKVLRSNPGKPVVIADTTDNPGAGAPGDLTTLLRAMLERDVQGAAIATIWDPVATQVAMDAGERARLPLRIGGKMGPFSGDPLDVDAEVIKIVENATHTFQESATVGTGDSVVIRVAGIDIILNTIRTQIYGKDVFSNMGIDPTRKRILVVKSSQHFHASFAPIAADVLYCDAGGSMIMDIKAIPYQHADQHKWPLVGDPFA